MKHMKVVLALLSLTLLFFVPLKLKENAPKELTKEESMLANMTLEQKVGQMFLVRCPEDEAQKMVLEYNLGGYILFSRDFANKTKDEVIKNIQSYQANASTPLLIAVDEEGGSVIRISKYEAFNHEPFKSPQELYNEGGLSKVREDTKDKARFLKNLGINLNLAPVADVSTNEEDYIYKRTVGKDAVTTALYVSNVVEVMKEEKIGSALKHFPGYGSNLDTHNGIAIDKRSLDEFRKSDFLPFSAGIKSNADIVMVSHNIVETIDPVSPASLSADIHNILKNELGFEGVIMTDDLYMDAIKKYTSNTEAAILAIEAGNDLICTTDFTVQIPAVIDAINTGRIDIKRIDESVLKILKMKNNIGIL